MSHASLLVAVDVVNPSDRSEVHAAVSFQMEPYDENGHWFKDGSRWDYWTIGGRYTGRLAPDYDPYEDPRNIEVCRLCGGTGKRSDMEVRNGCNGCDGKGTSVAWSLADFDGDIIRVKDLNKEAMLSGQQKRRAKAHDAAMAELAKHPDRNMCEMIYGFNPLEISKADYIASIPSWFPTSYAFLRARHWHEGERLGWFGSRASTECELKHPDDPDTLTRRCTTTGEENAKLVIWNEPWELWEQNFAKRFIEPLPPETTLVCVDYHV